jgi:hypothetical protein
MTKSEKDREQDVQPTNDETSYPPFKIVLPAMAAIWLAFFVVALVSTTTCLAKPSRN